MKFNILNQFAIDKIGVDERVARFSSRSIKSKSKVEGLKLALSMIDLTTLEGSDTIGKVRQLCFKAMHLHDAMANLPTVAAVCVYPAMVRYAKHELKNTNIKVASVATAFPSGQSSTKIIIEETKLAVGEGADEVDMVISRGKFLAGEYEFVSDEIKTIKDICGKIHLKVILETGELDSLDMIRHASILAMQSGADFIKTSTGKIQPASTMQFTLVMLEAIRDYFYSTGKIIGMKPAGGISNSKTALQYLVMLKETLGEDWMTPKLFRFGASRLANDILMQLVKEEKGNYQSLDYFSKD